jgi:hypothetical protein
MVIRIALAALFIFGVMVVVKDGRVLRAAGLTGSCSVVQTAADGEQMEACSSGKLEGAPDLTKSGCSDAGLYAGRVYWRCPASIVSSP